MDIGHNILTNNNKESIKRLQLIKIRKPNIIEN